MENVEESKAIEESSDSEIEKGKPKSKGAKGPPMTPDEPTTSGIVKKPYVLTEARKAQFEKARLKRQENLRLKREAIENTKKQQEEKLQVYEEIKKDLEVKKEKQQRKKKAKEIKQIIQELSSEESDDDDEVEQAELALKAILAKKAKKSIEPPKNFPSKPVPYNSIILPSNGMSQFRFC